MHGGGDRDAQATLAHIIISGHTEPTGPVVFITGAGLSAASGVPVFRGGEDSVWGKHAMRLATRRAFRQNPVDWYNRWVMYTMHWNRNVVRNPRLLSCQRNVYIHI
jgi:NAD-dependent SIR2 family protein deacetylase